MQVVIRTDASLQIGTGHVMRCLTLANALNEKGATIEFICRELPGNLIVYIENKGFTVHSLQGLTTSKPGVFRSQNNLSHSHWLGVSQEQDVKECEAVLESINPDWLIVDHYAIDCWWQNQLKGHYKKLMVIDDLADRRHECDLLLDQTFGRKEEEYRSLVPQDCHLLIGSQYALLRPEFSQWREFSLRRRATNPELKKILITMGGVDLDNVTGQVLEVLKICELTKNLTITVVMGATALNLDKVKQTAGTMPYKTEVKENVTNMAELMAHADVAIGAAGATTWERCCLGLPSIQTVVADNQMAIASILSSINAIKYLKELSDLPSNLKGVIKWYRKISIIASAVTDGKGCERVCNYFVSKANINEEIELKPADSSDCEFVYHLQTSAVRQYFKTPKTPTLDEHKRWFKDILVAKDSVLFVLTLNLYSVGILRLDDLNGDEMEISIIIAPNYSRRGIAKTSLKHIFELLPGHSFKAVVHNKNIASKKLFEMLSFNKVGASGLFEEYLMNA